MWQVPCSPTVPLRRFAWNGEKSYKGFTCRRFFLIIFKSHCLSDLVQSSRITRIICMYHGTSPLFEIGLVPCLVKTVPLESRIICPQFRFPIIEHLHNFLRHCLTLCKVYHFNGRPVERIGKKKDFKIRTLCILIQSCF